MNNPPRDQTTAPRRARREAQAEALNKIDGVVPSADQNHRTARQEVQAEALNEGEGVVPGADQNHSTARREAQAEALNKTDGVVPSANQSHSTARAEAGQVQLAVAAAKLLRQTCPVAKSWVRRPDVTGCTQLARTAPLFPNTLEDLGLDVSFESFFGTGSW
jgi:hypothetical protein